MYVVNVGHSGTLPLPTTAPGGPTAAPNGQPGPAAQPQAPAPSKAAQVLAANLNQIAHQLEQEGKADDAAICRDHAKMVEAAADFVSNSGNSLNGPLPLPTWD